MAHETRPKIVLCGYTSYPRDYDYAEFKRIADEVGALTMADVLARRRPDRGGVLRNPFDAGFDVVTTTTHKSLRGPRGGLVLCRKRLAARDRQVGVPRPAGRAAHEHHRRHRRDAEEGAGARVPRLRGAGAAQRASRSPPR